MQQLQYEALTAQFRQRAELEEQLLPTNMQVYVPTVESLTFCPEELTTDEQRSQRIEELLSFLADLAANMGLLALLGDPQAKAILSSIGTVVCSLDVAKAVANASVVQVTVGNGTEG